MEVLKLVVTIVQVVFSLALIAIVLLQSGKNAGLSGAIAGAGDSFMSKNKSRSWDARLAKVTKWVAAIFIVLTLGLNLI